MSKSLNKSNISDYFSSKVASVKDENLSAIDKKRISKDDVDKPKKKKQIGGNLPKTHLLVFYLHFYLCIWEHLS